MRVIAIVGLSIALTVDLATSTANGTTLAFAGIIAALAGVDVVKLIKK